MSADMGSAQAKNHDSDATRPRIRWYRSPVSRDDLARLNRRSDFEGFCRAGGVLSACPSGVCAIAEDNESSIETITTVAITVPADSRFPRSRVMRNTFTAEDIICRATIW